MAAGVEVGDSLLIVVDSFALVFTLGGAKDVVNAHVTLLMNVVVGG